MDADTQTDKQIDRQTDTCGCQQAKHCLPPSYVISMDPTLDEDGDQEEEGTDQEATHSGSSSISFVSDDSQGKVDRCRHHLLGTRRSGTVLCYVCP